MKIIVIMINNYCKVSNPLNEYKKQILIGFGIIFVVIIVFYIISPGISAATSKITPHLSKLGPTNNKVKSIILIIFMLIIVSIVAFYIFYHTAIYQRQERCLSVYQFSSYPQIKLNSPKLSYHNPYFNQEMTYLLRDFYILSGAQVSLPCGQYNDLSSVVAIENVIKRGARWLEFNIYWTPENNYDKNPTCYVSTGNGQQPTSLIWNDSMLELVDAMQTCVNNAWKDNDCPLFIYLQADKLLPQSLLPSLFLEKYIANVWSSIFYERVPSPKYMNLKENLAEIPIQDTIGKVFLILNWTPQEESLRQVTTDIVQVPNGQFPRQGIQNIVITPEDLPYGGIKSKFVDSNELIKYNKLNMTRMKYQTQPKSDNITSPKADIDNIDPFTAFDFGVQIIPQHFTIFPGKEKCFLRTLEFFKDGPLRVKPDNLRYIPKPAPPVKKQYTNLSYAPKEYVNSRPGFAKLQI